jgi:hypothetical protein
MQPMTGPIGLFEWGGKAGRGDSQGNNSGAGGPIDASVWGTFRGKGPAKRPMNSYIYKGGFPDHGAPGSAPDGTNWAGDDSPGGREEDTKLNLEVFRCPGDDGYKGFNYTGWRASGLPSYDHYGNSYVANTAWIMSAALCGVSSNASFARPVQRIPTPQRTIMYYEMAGRIAWRANYGQPCMPNEFDDSATLCNTCTEPGAPGCTGASCGVGSADWIASGKPPVRGWHGRAWWFDAAFCDGSARTINMKGHHRPAPRMEFYSYTQDIGTVGSHYCCWFCVTIRGPGWSLDCLPAPAVRTTFTVPMVWTVQ